MRRAGHPFSREQLDFTVRVMCPLVRERIYAHETQHWPERSLRRELVACILGSQVRLESAIGTTKNLEHAGLLDDPWWESPEHADFESHVFDVLTARIPDLPYPKRYRFPQARSRQLALTRDALAQLSLVSRLASCDIAKDLRQTLVADIAGLGPKQASMFLRNTGISYDLAILDSHVLRFIEIQELAPDIKTQIGSVRGYEAAERALLGYAESIGYSAGYLDIAIWVTMRAAQELRR